jgi:DNA-directed RNA polymerase subunit RPC12/RpoP
MAVQAMKLLSLTCNHCGAPLEAPTKTRYLTCAYCNSRLEVKREGQAVYTEVLEAIEERTARIAEDVEAIKLQNEIERLDREWHMGRERYMVKGKDGQISVPSTAGSLVGGLVAAGFGVAWTIFAASMGAPFFFPLFGVVFVVLAIAGTFSGASKADAYRRSQESYESRRRELLARLREGRETAR